MVTRFLVTLALCIPLFADADIYRCISASGTVTFTDQPCTGGKRVEIQDQRVGSRIATDDMVSLSATLAHDRQVAELKRDIRARADTVAELRRSMREDLAELQRLQNLPSPIHDGVFWEQLLSQKQQVTVQKYEALIRSEQKQIDHRVERLEGTYRDEMVPGTGIEPATY